MIDRVASSFGTPLHGRLLLHSLWTRPSCLPPWGTAPGLALTTPTGVWLMRGDGQFSAVKGRVALSPRSGVPNERTANLLTSVLTDLLHAVLQRSNTAFG